MAFDRSRMMLRHALLDIVCVADVVGLIGAKQHVRPERHRRSLSRRPTRAEFGLSVLRLRARKVRAPFAQDERSGMKEGAGWAPSTGRGAIEPRDGQLR